MTADTGRTFLALIATLSLVMSFFAFNAQPVLADGEGSPAACLNTTEGITGSVGTGDDDERSFTAESDEIVTGVCIKAGPGHSDLITADGTYEDGCYSVEGIGTRTVTVTRLIAGPTCPGISHLDVRTEEANPDLAITKSADADSVNAGDAITYTITVDNNGDAIATGVQITDDLDDSLTVDSATFAVDSGADSDCSVGAGNTITCDVGDLAAGSQAVATVVVTTSAESCDMVSNVSSISATNDEGDTSDQVDVTVVCEDRGSITVTKEFEDCVACEAFTPGYWFNRGGGGGVDWATDWLMANPQSIPGISDADGFSSIEEIQAYLDWDISGGDGASGLSATGQLLRHYLALVLNVAFAEANDCDFLGLVYGDADIETWLQRAYDALTGDATDAEKEAIKDALDAINNSDAGDGTLECPSEATGGSVAGFTFKLWVVDEEAEELVVVDEMTTDESGSVTFGDLQLGVEYTITEVAPEGLECTIVSAWMGETELEVVDGMITVTLTEGENTANVTITVVNECEQPGEEDEFGDVIIIKDADDDTDEPFGFSASWTGGGDDFDLIDGQAWPSGDVLAGTVITVTEELTAEQLLAGWSLHEIDCGDAVVDVAGDSVTITVMANTTITCTFTNELEEDEGPGETVEVSIMKHLCTDVASVAQFEAIEAAAAAANPENPAAPLVATVLACPTIVLTGDIPTDGAVSGGEVDFEFSVRDASGTQLLSEDGMFMQGALCEADVNLDADGDGEITADVCLDVSHYTFEVSDGIVVITETDAPAGHRFGTIRFTPGSDDADALVGTITSVEASGVIVLDTRADADDSVMVHAYNFVTEDTQGGNPGPGAETPREGTAGGNPLPDTSTAPAPGGSLPAILLAVMAIGALTVGGRRMAEEARSRR